jgi:hypothetical protein
VNCEFAIVRSGEDVDVPEPRVCIFGDATALAFARDGAGLVVADIDEQVIRSRIADPPPRQLEPNPRILPSISRRHHQ